jgi:vacuolar protein sorting-associated protein 35
LNGLIDLINTNLDNMDNPDQHPPTPNSSSLVQHDGPISEYVRRHFRETLLHLKKRKEHATRVGGTGLSYEDLDLGDI